MHAVVGVRRPVQVPVPLVLRVPLLVAVLDDLRVGRVGEDFFEEIDVAGMVYRVEFPRRGVRHDHHASRAHQRLAPVQVEEIPEPQAGHQDRVHDRVDVVGAQVGQPHREHVGLALNPHEVLAIDVLERHPVDRFDLARLDRRQSVRRADATENAPGRPARHHIERRLGADQHQPILRRHLPFPALEKAVGRRERVVVECGLDLEHLHAGRGQQAALAPVARVQLGVLGIHERFRVPHGVHVVVVTQRRVPRQPGGDALVAAVHRNQVDVHVHQQV